MATGGRTARQRLYYKAGAASVTSRTIGQSTYGGMSNRGSTCGRSGNLAEITLAETETGRKSFYRQFRRPNRSRSRNSVALSNHSRLQ